MVANFALQVNAGAADTAKLHERVSGLVKEKGLKLNVAYVDGGACLRQPKIPCVPLLIENRCGDGHCEEADAGGQGFQALGMRHLSFEKFPFGRRQTSLSDDDAG